MPPASDEEPTLEQVRQALRIKPDRKVDRVSEGTLSTADDEVTREMARVRAALGLEQAEKPDLAASTPAKPEPITNKTAVPIQRRAPNPNIEIGTIFEPARILSGVVLERSQLLIKKFGEKQIDSAYLYKHLLMSPYEYIDAVKNRRSLYAELLKQQAAALHPSHPNYAPHNAQMYIRPATWTFLLEPHQPSFTPDEDGWIKYLKHRHPQGVQDALNKPPRPAVYAEKGRHEHTLIVAPSNWGKSELIKALLYHYAQDGSAAAVVLDPGGDLVKQVRKWPELVRENRLCLIQPGLDQDEEEGGFIGADLTVGFNPLDGSGLDVEGRRVIATDWAYTLGLIGADRHDLSANMMLLVTMCVQVLLTVPGATLADLGHLLMPRPPRNRKETDRPEAENPRAAELQRLARNYEVASVANFFRHDFDTDDVEGTRKALRRRITMVLNYPHAEAMLTGRATINLENEIEARRFIMVDLSRFSKIGGAAIGRLFLAQVTAIGRRRERQALSDRTPTHVFIDEASTMVSASMFEITREMRKYGIYLTLAQQVGGDEMTPEQKARLKIVGCKMVAPSSVAADWITPDEYNTIPKVGPREFVTEWAGFEDIEPVKVRSDLAGFSHRVSPFEWREHLQAITGPGGYYRPAGLAQTVPLEEPAEGQPEPRQTRHRRPNVPPDVPPELADKFTSKTGRESDW